MDNKKIVRLPLSLDQLELIKKIATEQHRSTTAQINFWIDKALKLYLHEEKRTAFYDRKNTIN